MKLCFIPAAWRQVGLVALFGLCADSAQAGIPEPDLVWYGKVMASSGGVPVRVTAGTLVWQIEPLAGGPAVVLTTTLTNVNNQFSFVVRVPCESSEPGVEGSHAAIQLSTPPRSYRRLTVTLEGEPLALISTANEFSPLPTHRGRAERIDLQLGAAPVDADGDGLSDAWELLHFGSLSAVPHDDPDGDGLDNLGEFRAGTDPHDAQSRFEVVEVAEVPGGVAVRWSSQPERSYRVRRSSTLLAAPTDYEVVKDGLAATPPMNEFIDTTVGDGAVFFYLIEIEE
jgi:hypothetical protein